MEVPSVILEKLCLGDVVGGGWNWHLAYWECEFTSVTLWSFKDDSIN